MAIWHRNNISWVTFHLFDQYGIPHGFFMRHGGCSPNPWKSLNLATTVGDTRENVIENRRRIAEAIGIESKSFFDVWQVHGNKVIYSALPRELDVPHMKGDAIVTDASGVTLLMLFADCVPIMFFDLEKNAAMIIHAGWQGTVKGIVADAARFMIHKFGSKKKDLIAGIGPAICQSHYEVGRDIYEFARNNLGGNVTGKKEEEKYYLDLAQTNMNILQSEGIIRIERMSICTACCTMDWFSHREEMGNTGRFAGIIKPIQ